MSYQATIYQGAIVRWPLPPIEREPEDVAIPFAPTAKGREARTSHYDRDDWRADEAWALQQERAAEGE